MIHSGVSLSSSARKQQQNTVSSPDIEAAIKAIKKECTNGLLPNQAQPAPRRNNNFSSRDTVPQAENLGLVKLAVDLKN